MKKGFTMIELIFVIVILGILASVAIPRLAATRTDAEIATTVSNIRTLIGDLSSYYVVKGSFKDATWGDVTNVPIRDGGRNLVKSNDPIVTKKNWNGVYYLSAGGRNCLAFRVKDRDNTQTPARPAYIEIGKVHKNQNDYICAEIIKAEPIAAYLVARLSGDANPAKDSGRIALGSSARIYN